MFNGKQVYKDMIGTNGLINDDQIETKMSATSQSDTYVYEI